MKRIFFALLVANLALAVFVYVRDRLPNPDAQLVNQQMNADQIRIVPPRPVPAPAQVTPAPRLVPATEMGQF